MGIGLIKFKLYSMETYFIILCSDVSKMNVNDLLNFLDLF